MTGTMNAVVYRDVEQLELCRLPIPECPNDGLLVKIYACGICGGDVRNYHNGLKGGIKNQIIGHEISGEVIKTGKSARRFKKGDRVAIAPDVSCGSCWYCRKGMVNLCDNHLMLGTHFPGGFAQYISLHGDILSRGFVEPIPDEMPWEYAAFAETVSAVLACQKKINVSLGDSVLIIGDGPVGCLHIEAARARGASLVMLAGLDRLSLAEKFDPDLLLDNRYPAAVNKSVLEKTGGIGADHVILAVPSVRPQAQALELVRKGGVVVIYGGVPKNAAETLLDSNLIHYREITVTGSFSYPSSGLADALSAIHAGKIRPDRYIGARIPLSHVVEGMEMIENGQSLKVVIDPWMD